MNFLLWYSRILLGISLIINLWSIFTDKRPKAKKFNLIVGALNAPIFLFFILI